MILLFILTKLVYVLLLYSLVCIYLIIKLIHRYLSYCILQTDCLPISIVGFVLVLYQALDDYYTLNKIDYIY